MPRSSCWQRQLSACCWLVLWLKHNGVARAGVARRKARRMVADQLWGTHPHPVTVAVQWGMGILVRSHPQFNPVQAGQATETRGLEEADQWEEGTLMQYMPLT